MKNIKITKLIVSLALASSVLLASNADHKSHWSYAGSEGPSHWGNLKSSYVDCKIGKRQSPINIKTSSNKLGVSDAGIYVNYNDVNLDIVNNGHTIQVNIADGNEALIGGKKYKLLQFHFHAPSEHTIDGKAIPMEAHLVHQSADGELAVIGVLLKEGSHNTFIQKIFKNMPINASGHKKTSKLKVNATDILPASRAHWHYLGSLTTPPCTQIVEWYLLKEPITISSKQLKHFHKLYKGNARPAQKLNNRTILQK